MYTNRAETHVVSPQLLEYMLERHRHINTPVSLMPLPVQAAMIREAFAAQNFPPSQPALKAAEPDQRGFIIGGTRL